MHMVGFSCSNAPFPIQEGIGIRPASCRPQLLPTLVLEVGWELWMALHVVVLTYSNAPIPIQGIGDFGIRT